MTDPLAVNLIVPAAIVVTPECVFILSNVRVCEPVLVMLRPDCDSLIVALMVISPDAAWMVLFSAVSRKLSPPVPVIREFIVSGFVESLLRIRLLVPLPLRTSVPDVPPVLPNVRLIEPGSSEIVPAYRVDDPSDTKLIPTVVLVPAELNKAVSELVVTEVEPA